MRLSDWLRRLFGRRRKPGKGARTLDMVSYFDVETGRVVRIPASELRPGVIQARFPGIDGLVWVCPEDLHQGEIRHPPFDEPLRGAIRRIREAFAEHRPLSAEAWEEGFRRDADPTSEVTLWLHAAEVYAEFADGEDSTERRRDLYRTIIACLNTSPASVGHVLRPTALAREEAEQVVRRFYGDDLY